MSAEEIFRLRKAILRLSAFLDNALWRFVKENSDIKNEIKAILDGG